MLTQQLQEPIPVSKSVKQTEIYKSQILKYKIIIYNTTADAATTVTFTVTTAFGTSTESIEFKVYYRRTLINIYNKQHVKIKVNYMEIKESGQFLVQRKYP
jgi:hypothetical protein